MQSDLARRIFRDSTRQGILRAGDRVGVGVSGGADSVALLLLLEELAGQLGIRLTVLHFNHQLRGAESDADERFVAALSAEHGIPSLAGREDVAGAAREHGWNLEDAGRRLRYAYFASVLDTGGVTRVAVAHTADDQAETVLGRLVRGTGPAGLAAIYPISDLSRCASSAADATLVRPLLGVRRGELCEYLERLGQPWREDASNQDTQRLRARVRHQILPLIEREQPAIVAHLGRLAQMAREDEAFWTAQVAERLGALVRRNDDEVPDGRLAIRCADLLAPLPWAGSNLPDAARLAVSRRLVRGLVEKLRGDCRDLTAQHVEQVMRLATSGASGQSSDLPGVIVERSFEWLWFRTAVAGTAAESGYGERESPGPRAAAEAYSHAVELGLPGEATVVEVPEIGRRFRLKVIDWSGWREENYDLVGALDRDRLHSPLVLRSWRPGDSFRPQGRRSVHKLKQFLRIGRVAAGERAGWPVLTSAGELVWARGLPAATEFAPREMTRTGVVIEEEKI